MTMRPGDTFSSLAVSCVLRGWSCQVSHAQRQSSGAGVNDGASVNDDTARGGDIPLRIRYLDISANAVAVCVE